MLPMFIKTPRGNGKILGVYNLPIILVPVLASAQPIVTPLVISVTSILAILRLSNRKSACKKSFPERFPGKLLCYLSFCFIPLALISLSGIGRVYRLSPGSST